MLSETYMWFVFAAVFIVLMAADLGITDRRDSAMDIKRATRFVILYVAVALIFGLLIFYEMGAELATSYYAAYVIELSMSVDNLFVFIVIFGIFMIPPEKQHRVLYWGILGAICFRALFIVVGAELLANFHFMMYVFGAILIYTAIKTAFSDDDEDDEKESVAFRLSRHIRATPDMSSGRFFTKENGKRLATPLFLCLVVIEISDIMFAFDSIPAALSISTDIFIIYASNIFAVMGLRSMYFVIRDAIGSMEYLKYGLGVILAFIGAKMLLAAANIMQVEVVHSLLFILVVLGITVMASVLHSRKQAGGA